MQILLNGQPASVSASKLDEALAELGYSDAKVATAVNGAFVPVVQRSDLRLNPGDRLEVLAPMQGG